MQVTWLVWGCEVADVGFVVEFEESQGVVLFCAGVEYLSGVVGESREVYAVFLAWYGFCLLPFLDVEDVHRVIVGGCDQEFSLVVKVQ